MRDKIPAAAWAAQSLKDRDSGRTDVWRHRLGLNPVQIAHQCALRNISLQGTGAQRLAALREKL